MRVEYRRAIVFGLLAGLALLAATCTAAAFDLPTFKVEVPEQ